MRAAALAAAFAITCGAAQAQDYDAMAAQMDASMAAAQAQAIRPGDEALTCEQIQTEMAAAMQDPAVQTVIADMGAWGVERQAQADAARRGAGMQIAGGMAMGLASAFIPGAGFAAMAAQQAMMAGAQARASQNQADVAELGASMETIMPQMMRGQRLYELAQQQQCAFLEQADAEAFAPDAQN
ncbi:MAG: hypothetical protein AB7P07_03750 [Hyphomonadaceae bacterium]